jgi:hypothetical protein
MKAQARYEAEAFGLTPEGTTSGQHTLTEGFCSASFSASAPSNQPERSGAWSGGGRERVALRPGFGAEPQGRCQLAAGGRITSPANDVGSLEPSHKCRKLSPDVSVRFALTAGARQERRLSAAVLSGMGS